MIKMTHIAFHVKDIEKSMDFYSRYCGLKVVHDRSENSKRVLWMGEEGKEKDFILVFIAGGNSVQQKGDDYSHLGFALSSKEQVDEIALQAKKEGILFWETREEPFPVGYYCGVFDPDGKIIEFSFGQPLGNLGSENR
ncbi:MAG: VOC family protein [Spirochaetia bacterium]|nr:VOC family protein [Spirochaetia bacterium]